MDVTVAIIVSGFGDLSDFIVVVRATYVMVEKTSLLLAFSYL